MTNDNNTRSKANAVFFSVIMVLSMVAVGFAAAPAAAVESGDSVSADAVTLSDSAAIATGVTYTTDFSVSGAANSNVNASYVSITSSDIDLGGVQNSDVTVLGGASTTIYDASQDQLIVNLTSQQTIANGDSPSIQVDGLTNPTQGDYTLTLGLHSDDGNGAPVTGSNSGVITDSSNTFTINAAYSSGSTQRSAGEDEVFNGSTVYQGEDGLTFLQEDGTNPSPGSLQKTAGSSEGTSLTLPIPEDAATGTYAASDGFNVIVQQPRITTAEVQINGSDSDVSQVGPDVADNLTINGEWNFGEAENLSITVEDSSGTDITGEVVDNPTLSDNDGVAETGFDLGGEDAGEYTVIFEGEDDLDYGSVVQEYTIELTTDDTVSVETAEDTVTQGTNLQYTVTGGTNGQYHIVTIDSEDFRSDSIDSVFRNVGDTVTAGFAESGTDNTSTTTSGQDVAFAVLEVDGTTAIGSIRTQSLDDTSVTIDVYNASSSDDTYRPVDNLESVDDQSLDVEEGSITLDSPDGQYTIGSEVDISGTATSSDAVDIYARDNNEWELVFENINVDSADEFEEEDVVLSQTGNAGTSILQQTGTYRLGAIDRSESNGASIVTTSNFSSATSVQNSITVVEGELSAELVTINGQINTLDNAADISGNAEGQDQIALVYVDSRGDVAAQPVDVENDGTIDITDRTIPEASDGSVGGGGGGPLAEGAVSAHFISMSRDNAVGDGQMPGGQDADIDGLVKWVNEDVADRSLNANQARSLIVSETTDDTASDDLMVTQTFRYAESQTGIDSVYPEVAQADGINPVATGETMVVAGSTNLRPDDNSITVEILDADGNSLQISSTDEWATSGQWNTTIDTSDLEPGTYTVESDDGENTDRATVEIVEERQTDDGEDGQDGEDGEDGGTDGEDGGTDGEDGDTDGEDGGTDGEDGGADGDDGGTDGDDGGTDGDDGGDGGTDDSTPGFGALVALVALIAAALLATRRND